MGEWKIICYACDMEYTHLMHDNNSTTEPYEGPLWQRDHGHKVTVTPESHNSTLEI